MASKARKPHLHGSLGTSMFLLLMGMLAACATTQAAQLTDYKCEKSPFDRRSDRGRTYAQTHRTVTAKSPEEAKAVAAELLGIPDVVCRPIVDRESTGPVNTAPVEPSRLDPRELPFSNLPMGDYFNAVHNGDLAEVRRQDDKYLGKAIADFRERLNQPIFKGLLNALELDRATLVVVSIRTYVQNYGEVYQACLKSDALSFTIRTTIRDRYGLNSSDAVYRMNPEFAHAFESTADLGQHTALSDNLAATGEVAYGMPNIKMENATRQLMRAWRCDDSTIKRFERHLIEMYSTITTGKR